ncbi:serine/threonine-protein kinase [Acrasis kona]|uniref:Serine/threonine-protein kinase n=1 Tax=Acrasis kona TaxID=1008807 RepID=A0AAW2ZLP1_9EUKA
MNASLKHSYSYFVAKNPEIELIEPLLDNESISSKSSFVYDIQNYIIEAREISFDSKISEGTFGVVFSGRYIGSKVAIKMIKRQESESEFEHEVRMLIMLRHPNIVLFIGACVADGYKYIVTEIMAMTLGDALHSKKKEGSDSDGRHLSLTFINKINILKDVASALTFMNGREHPICHRDLKPSNVLLNQDMTVAKICDLGSSRNIASDMTSNTGTYTYMSPEMLFGQKYTEKSDVYSYAIIMYEVFFEMKPFATQLDQGNDFMITMSISKGERPKIPDIIESLTEGEREYINLMTRCWNQDPDTRPSFAEISSCLDLIKNS